MKVKKTDTGILFDLGRCSIELCVAADRKSKCWLTTCDLDRSPGDPPHLLVSKGDIAKLGRELVKYAETL